MTAPDLTAINVPFGLLDEVYGPGTAQALKDSGGPWEYLSDRVWWKIYRPAWDLRRTYRLAPAHRRVTRDMWMHEDGSIYTDDECAPVPGWTLVRVTFTPGDPASYRVEVRE